MITFDLTFPLFAIAAQVVEDKQVTEYRELHCCRADIDGENVSCFVLFSNMDTLRTYASTNKVPPNAMRIPNKEDLQQLLAAVRQSGTTLAAIDPADRVQAMKLDELIQALIVA